MTPQWVVVLLDDEDQPTQARGPYDDHDAAVLAALDQHPADYSIVPLAAPSP